MRIRWPGILSLLLPIVFLSMGHSVARDLTFEDRVAAQQAIERVYYSHQVGATKPFEEAVPPPALERKVRTYLEQSAALEVFWKISVTDEMLGSEMERMAAGTRLPERLLELYSALGNDPFLIKECLARQILVNRLTRNFFAFDTRIHREARHEAQEIRRQLSEGTLDPSSEYQGRSVVRLSLQKPGFEPAEKHRNDPQETGDDHASQDLSPEEFREQRSRWPGAVGEVSQVQEERDAFVIHVVLSETRDETRGAVYRVQKTTWEEWWRKVEDRLEGARVRPAGRQGGWVPLPATRPGPAHVSGNAETEGAPREWENGWVSAGTPCGPPDNTWDNGSLDDVPDPRYHHTAVWTGSLMLIWGGYGAGMLMNSGGRYDPATDTWSSISTTNAPSARYYHTAVWTGSLMLVWGGRGGTYLNTGGRYDPVADTWSPISTTNAPIARSSHTAVWTGSLMVVWGGRDGGTLFDTGGRYDPATDSWASISTLNAPSGRSSHTAVWTGSLMLVWGGFDGSYVSTGGRYDPVADTWSAASIANAPGSRAYHTAVWSGGLMVIWGGYDGSITLNTGGRYDPATDSWAPTSTVNAPSGRYAQTAVWTGGLMLVWDGTDVDGYAINTGGRYDPAADLWSPISPTNAPSARSSHTAVWTGSLMVVWGGDDGNYVSTGGRYDPTTDSWTPTSNTTAPTARGFGHTGIWTGSLMVVWGGSASATGPSLDTGGRYDPATDVWTPTSTTNPPTARYGHTAIWTGSLMVVWGGYSGSYINNGGRYDPATDTWTPTSTTNAPNGREGHTAVWTGSLMIVWGGANDLAGLAWLNTGGRYDPATDSWTPTTITNAPSGRWRHTTVWTGSRMLVWGGSANVTGGVPVFNTGGHYDPATDSWTPISTANAPSIRYVHTAVWTGSLMVVWGGTDNASYFNTGGRYDPISNTWTPTSTANAPSGRAGHRAIWTGSLMVVWGGYASNGQIYFNTGGRYDPVADTWTPTSTANAPSARAWHTMVWTGSVMMVWGGRSSIEFSSGGRLVVSDFPDLDGDGYPGCADCNDADALAWHAPVEATNLVLAGAGPTSVSWDGQGAVVGPGTVYDLVSGAVAGGVSFSGVCLQAGGSSTYSDTRVSPAPGFGYWYLARGKNSCGAGTYGTGQRDAAVTACP